MGRKSQVNYYLTKTLLLIILLMPAARMEAKVRVKNTSPQTTYAASRLSGIDQRFTITIAVSGKGETEGFTITRKGRKINITGNDGSGAIYGANRLLELYQADPTFSTLTIIREMPEMMGCS